MPYKAITNVSCGKIYTHGKIIPDAALTEDEAARLLELGAIEVIGSTALIVAEPPVESVEDTPTEIESGIITDDTQILAYVNSADQKDLERIKGIGAATAKAMKNHGHFSTMEELDRLISNVNWDKIKIV